MERNILLDNVKSFLIFLMVLGHLIEPLLGKYASFNIVYNVIYSFHMPAFVFVSGMLSRKTKSNASKLISSLLVPLVLFTGLYELFEILFANGISHYTMSFAPYWMLWYLLSLFCWKIMLPYFLRLKYPLVLSVLIALLAGYVNEIGYFMGLSRTLYFFPFFVAGNLLGINKIIAIRKNKFLKITAVFVLFVNVSCFAFFPEFNYKLFYGSLSYEQIAMSGVMASLIRFAILCLSFLSLMAVLILLPEKKNRFSIIGQNTLDVYLLHGFFVKLLIGLGACSYCFNISAYFVFLCCIFMSMVLVFVLAKVAFLKHFNTLVTVPLNKLILRYL